MIDEKKKMTPGVHMLAQMMGSQSQKFTKIVYPLPGKKATMKL